MLGKGYLGKTIVTTVFFSAALQAGSILPSYSGDFMLIAIYGGLIDGLGIGFILRGMASTGGVDLLASLIHSKAKHIPLSKIIFAIDVIIIVFGVFVFGAERTMYGIISIFISSKFVSLVLEGLSFSKVAFIISEKNEEISDEIMKVIERGVTSLNGKGMYTGSEKNVLLCVFSQKEIKAVKDIVLKHDPDAFLIVSDVKEVLGEGFGAK